jgi:DNA polymerase III subunit alpha
MADDRLSRDPLQREAMKRAAKPARPFIHLRVHSAYSLLEGALQLPKIVAHAVADEAPAIAVTDTNNLFGALEFAQKAVKEGIQPIIGCQIDVAFGDENLDANRGYQKRSGPELFPVVLIAATQAGYANLVRLVSDAYLDNNPGEPVNVAFERLAPRREGLICLTGGPRGPIGAALKSGHPPLAESRLLALKALFEARADRSGRR